MAHRILTDHEANGYERSDFPILCQSCLGDNPYLRMALANFDKECKVCTRPFRVFRWRPGRAARYKKTEICQTCSKLKNVCQVCILDLEYGLPVQVRDTAPNITTRMNLQRTEPHYEKNQPHVCSFNTVGMCTRGAGCAFRHEMPKTGELSRQNIKDRFYGENDPLAMELLRKAGEMSTLEPPEDESIKTLYIGGLNSGKIHEQDIRDQFYAYGEIQSIRIFAEKACAFVTFTTRQGAEKAIQELSNSLVISGQRLKLTWGRPHVPKHDQSGLLPPPMQQQYKPYYPSMDPQRMGGSSTSENS
ncbi:hypothetical protein Bca4012_012805 [Brassica carinata]